MSEVTHYRCRQRSICKRYLLSCELVHVEHVTNDGALSTGPRVVSDARVIYIHHFLCSSTIPNSVGLPRGR